MLQNFCSDLHMHGSAALVWRAGDICRCTVIENIFVTVYLISLLCKCAAQALRGIVANLYLPFEGFAGPCSSAEAQQACSDAKAETELRKAGFIGSSSLASGLGTWFVGL
jgi:hypothetical protein